MCESEKIFTNVRYYRKLGMGLGERENVFQLMGRYCSGKFKFGGLWILLEVLRCIDEVSKCVVILI